MTLSCPGSSNFLRGHAARVEAASCRRYWVVVGPVRGKRCGVYVVNTKSRPRLQTVTVTAEPLTVRVEVALELAGGQALGTSSGPPTESGAARAAADATLGALERRVEGLRLGVDEVVVHQAGAHQWVTVVVSVLTRGGVEQLVGSALIGGSAPAAAVRATLQACNRRFESLVDATGPVASEAVGVDPDAPSSPSQGAELAGIVAHQLRGPLTNLYGYLQVVRTHFDTLDDRSRGAMLDRSMAGCRRLLGRLENLLALAGQEHPVPATSPQRVQVHAVARQALADVPGPTEGIENRCSPQLHVWADPDHLAQVLGNYIDNALRHGAPPVVIDALVVDGSVEVAVTDAGPGIDEHAMAQLFDPPHGRPPGATAGTGLGLYVAGLLAHANGDSVDVRRAVPTGTRASIRLPAA